MKIGLAAGHSLITTVPEREVESRFCQVVAEELDFMLTRSGHEVIVPGFSVYRGMGNHNALVEKIRLFNEEEVRLAVELHTNRGGGSYSCVLHHPSSTLGKALAIYIDQQYATAFPWRRKPDMKGLRCQKMRFLNETRMTAVMTEPGFTDDPKYPGWFLRPDAAMRYAAATYLGIMNFASWADGTAGVNA